MQAAGRAVVSPVGARCAHAARRKNPDSTIRTTCPRNGGDCWRSSSTLSRSPRWRPGPRRWTAGPEARNARPPPVVDYQQPSLGTGPNSGHRLRRLRALPRTGVRHGCVDPRPEPAPGEDQSHRPLEDTEHPQRADARVVGEPLRFGQLAGDTGGGNVERRPAQQRAHRCACARRWPSRSPDANGRR